MFIAWRTLPACLLILLPSISFRGQDSLVSSSELQTLTRWITTSVDKSEWKRTLRIQPISLFYVWEHSSLGILSLSHHCLVQSQNWDPEFEPIAPYSWDLWGKYLSNLWPAPSLSNPIAAFLETLFPSTIITLLWIPEDWDRAISKTMPWLCYISYLLLCNKPPQRLEYLVMPESRRYWKKTKKDVHKDTEARY